MSCRLIRTVCVVAAVIVGLAPVVSAQEAEHTSPGGRFVFHVDPWIALHHFAFHFVREELYDLKLRGRVPLMDEDRRALDEEFRAACSALVPAYRPYIEGSLLFNPATRGLGVALLEGPGALSDSDVRQALEACMPAYRALFWPRHRRASEALIASLQRDLSQYEEPMAAGLVEIFEGTWPDAPIRVDVTPYANWAGAYTDASPANITLASYDRNSPGAHALEMLFHEASHTNTFSEPLIVATTAALETAGIKNDRLWHYVMFFATGRLAKQMLGEDYVPYSEAHGLVDRESAAPFYRALDATWDEETSLTSRITAAAQIVANQR